MGCQGWGLGPQSAQRFSWTLVRPSVCPSVDPPTRLSDPLPDDWLGGSEVVETTSLRLHILVGSVSVLPAPARLASLWGLCRVWWRNPTGSGAPPGSEGCALRGARSGWCIPFTCSLAGPGSLSVPRVSAAAPLPGSHALRGTGRAGKREAEKPGLRGTSAVGRPQGVEPSVQRHPRLSSSPRGMWGSGLKGQFRGAFQRPAGLISYSLDARHGN